jgi:peptide/nickel transport system permease protein
MIGSSGAAAEPRATFPKTSAEGDGLGAPPGLRDEVWRFFRHNPPALASVVFIAVLLLAAAFAPALAPYGPLRIAPADRLQAPSLAHPFGTDNLGRDVLSRVLYGGRTSLYVGASTVILGTFGGALLGMVSGYFGGAADILLQRLLDALQALPGLVFAMALISVLGASTNNVVIAISVFIISGNARTIRGTVLQVKSQEYIQAARAMGCGNLRIMLRHVLINVMGTLTILASVTFATAILAEASLSFLGLGTPPPNPSWGGMLSGSGRDYLEVMPTLALFPGLAIVFTVLSFNLLGDALRDLADPHTRKL